MNQTLLTSYWQLDQYWETVGVKRLFLVCGASIKKIPIGTYFATLPQRLGIEVIRFSDFQPNPKYESVVTAVQAFRESRCDMIVAAGGGSAMDVGKSTKLWCCSNLNPNDLPQTVVPNDVKFLAIPTTAGSGSEATRFVVIYKGGKKQSISSEDCIPSAVFFDSDSLAFLPQYHKKSAMLDALCHGIESFWSVNSTEKSKAYSSKAIRLIMNIQARYLRDSECSEDALKAAYLAGKAINITQTTAGHAMCYQLTSLYGISHGHSAALCISSLWPYMLSHTEDCVDLRGSVYLETVFQEIAEAMGCATASEAAVRFQSLVNGMGLETRPVAERDLDWLVASVAPERLRNHPIRIDNAAIRKLYRALTYPAQT